MINWNLLQTPDIGGALNAGMQAGREMKRQSVVQSALAGYAANPTDPQYTNALIAADPAIGFKLQDRQREQAKIEARRVVFGGGGTTAPVAQGMTMGEETPSAAPMTAGGAPAGLVDPSALPPRTDGLQVNQEALRALYQTDPDGALEIQKMVYSADKTGMERMKASGEVMATAAYRLSQLPPAQRGAELQAMMPQLTALGLDPRQIAGADLSDQSLDRYMTIGRSIKDVMAEDAAKYVSVPAGGTLVNVRDPKAVASMAGGGAPPIAPGAVINGKTFRGGDYRDPANWTGGSTPAASGNFP